MMRIFKLLLGLLIAVSVTCAHAIDGFDNIKFGTAYNEVLKQFSSQNGLKAGTDKIALEKFIVFNASIYELNAKVKVNFSSDKASSILVDFNRDGGLSMSSCRTRFERIVAKLKNNHKDYKLLTKGEAFEGLVTENAYLVFPNNHHIHGQMQFFAQDCAISILYDSVLPRFFR